jgi:hypothetical protein
LEDLVKPGLGEAEFFALFTKCAYCRLVMTKVAYTAHECDEDNVGTDVDEEGEGTDVDVDEVV